MSFVPMTLMQLADPTAILGLPGSLRALIAFVVVLGLGSLLLWRYDGVVERSIAASIDRPLASLGYGMGAQAGIAFVGFYSVTQLSQLPSLGRFLTGLGLWLVLGLLCAAGALGFTVVGAGVVELGWGRGRWHGLLIGAILAGGVALDGPAVGAIVWIVVVSMGIGGPIRDWFLAAEDVG